MRVAAGLGAALLIATGAETPSAAAWIPRAGQGAVGSPEGGAPEGPVRPGVRYALDGAATEVSFELKATGHKVHGRAGRVEGWFRAGPGGEGGAVPLEGEVRVAAAELSTANRRRDAKMHRQSLAVEEHPWIVFRPVRWVRSGGDGGEDRLVGVLEVRGVEQELEIPVRVEARGNGVAVAGEVAFRWSEFGVPNPSFLFLRVRELMTVRFDAVFRPSREAPGKQGRP